MARWDFLKRDVRELFTTSKTRVIRRQCEFHLKVAEPMALAAFGADEAAWTEYYEELGRAIAADTGTTEGRWLRSKAAVHYFATFRAGASELKVREMARTWDRDLKLLLTNFPDKEPKGMSLRGAREMREHFELVCRGLRID